MLQAGHDRCGAGVAEVVEQVVAVEPSALAADLHQPRPDRIWRGVDCDRPGRLVLGSRQQRITGQRCGGLGRCGTPAQVPSPVERRCQEGREVAKDIAKFTDDLPPGWSCHVRHLGHIHPAWRTVIVKPAVSSIQPRALML